MDLRQSNEFGEYLTKLGWNVINYDKTKCFVKKIPIIGNFVKVQRPEIISGIVINKIISELKPYTVIVEPKDSKQASLISKFGFKLSTSSFLASKTLIIDLTKKENQILSEMKKDARSAIKKTKNSKFITYKSNDDLKVFRKIYRLNSKFQRYVENYKRLIDLRDSLKTENTLFITDVEQTSGAVFIKSFDKVYYWHGFTSKVGRKRNIQYQIIWQGLIWAKKKKAKIFDFEGIYDERFPNKSWIGFSHFKKSFGGMEICYPGCYKKIFVKNLFSL